MTGPLSSSRTVEQLVVVGVAVLHEGRVLAAQRSAPHEAAGRWELPGGKVEPGESLEEAAVREVAEELGCTVGAVAPLLGEQPVRPDCTLRAVVASLVSGEPVPREHAAVRWLAAHQLDEVAWLAPDVPFVRQLPMRLGGVR